jgi:hypothetical protein
MSRATLAVLLAVLLGVAAGCTPSSSTGTPTPANRPAATEPGKVQPDTGKTPPVTAPHIPADR